MGKKGPFSFQPARGKVFRNFFKLEKGGVLELAQKLIKEGLGPTIKLDKEPLRLKFGTRILEKGEPYW